MDILTRSIKAGDKVIMTGDDTSHELPLKSIQIIHAVDYTLFPGIAVLSVINPQGQEKFFLADACEPAGTLIA